MAPGRAPNKARLALLLWLFVAIFYFTLSYNYIRITSNDREFGEYVRYVAQLAGADGRSAKDIRELLLIKAAELSLPVTRDHISIKGERENLKIEVQYDADIEIPWFARQVYTKTFDHKSQFQGPRR
jgi:hypothetical protein